jgi:hypothetical protein
MNESDLCGARIEWPELLSASEGVDDFRRGDSAGVPIRGNHAVDDEWITALGRCLRSQDCGHRNRDDETFPECSSHASPPYEPLPERQNESLPLALKTNNGALAARLIRAVFG